MRFIGDLFIHRRNPFLYQELVEDGRRRRRFLDSTQKDLTLVAGQCAQDPDMALILDKCHRQLEGLKRELDAVGQARSRIRF